MGLHFDYVEWDDPDDPLGNVWHIAAAGLTPEDVEDVLSSPDASAAVSRTTGRPVVFGTTRSGLYVIVVYERTEEHGVVVIRPVTAYEVDPPG